MSGRIRRIALVLSMAGAVAAPFAFGAGAARAGANQIETGVWWQAQPDGGTLPMPPHVPAGGLWVSSNPSGPAAISAVRFNLPSGETNPVLTLTVAQQASPPAGAVPGGGVSLLACATSAAWTKTDPSTPGPWSAAPAGDCAKGQVTGVPSADGTKVTFELGSLASGAGGGSVSAVFVPAQVADPLPAAPAPLPAAGPGISSSFDVSFNPVKADAVAVTSASAAPGTATGSDAATAPTVDESSSVSSAPSGYQSFTAPSYTSAAPAAASPAPAAADAAPAASQAPALAASPPQAVRPVLASKAKRTTEQTVAGLVFLGLCGWAWQLFAKDAGAGAGLGAGAVAGARGGLAVATRSSSLPFRSLYDMPSTAISAPPRRFGTGERVGKPPPLR